MDQEAVPQSETAPDITPEPEKHRFSLDRKILILMGVILLAIVGIGAYFFLQKPPQEVSIQKPPPEPENVLLATVGERQIFRNDVREIALEQYLPSAITDEVIQSFLSTAVERAILDIEVVNQKLPIPESASKVEYYNSVKQEIISRNVVSAEIYSLSFWIPPPDEYPQKEEYNLQRNDLAEVMPSITQRLQSGEDAVEIAGTIYNSYPNLKELVSVNGIKYSGITDTEIVRKPRLVEGLRETSNEPFSQLLLSTPVGATVSRIWPDQSGGVVIKVLNKSTGTFVSYESWLDQKIDELVVYQSL